MVLLRKKIVGQGKTRVCNQTCYDAKSPKCHCICGGKNHGWGLTVARQNVRDYFLPLVEAQEAKVLEVVRHQEALPFGDRA
jgi:hypothetical protein